MNQFRTTCRAFIVALLSTGLMAVVRHFVFIPLFAFSPPIMPSLLAVMLAAWIDGLRSGLIATVINAGVLTLVYGGEIGFQLLSIPNLFRFVMFIAIGGVISWGIDALHAARQRAEDRQQELEDEVRRRKQAETELREREERIRLAVDAADIGTFDFNPITGEQKWSPRTKVMFGLPPDAEVSSISFRDRVHPDDQEQVNQAIQAAFDPSGDGTYRVECRQVWPDSTVHWFVAKGQALFEGEGTKRRASRFIGTVVDITERKHAEQILRETEERFRTLATHAPVGIFHTDGSGQCLFVNDTWCAIAGATLEQAIGNGWARFVHPEDQQRVIQEWQEATLNRRTHVTQFRFLNQEKGTRWVIATATAILDAAGELTGFVGTIVDLTERKAIEDAVRESEARLRGILDHTPAVISLKDLNGRYVSVNRGWEELYGVKNEQMVGLTNEELLSKTSSPHMSREIADRFIEIDRTVLQTGELIEFEDPMPYGDDLKLFLTVKFPIKDAINKITGIGGISIDITERRKAVDSLAAEQELLHHTIEVQDNERQLIAYEIHDGLIQYVTGALMQLEAMQSPDCPIPATDQIERVVSILRRAVAEGRRLIDGIRTPVLDGLGVAAAIENLIEEEERAHVQVEFIKDDDLKRMDPKIEEAVYRIAQEALTNTGKHSQSKNVRVELKRRGDKVHLEVQDWGVGFTPPNRVNGAVHGLRGMMERARIAGGSCTIKSAPGDGTRVVAELPYVLRN